MHNDALAHLIYAAADIVLLPFIFEPCGLAQVVAMRQALVPPPPPGRAELSLPAFIIRPYGRWSSCGHLMRHQWLVT